MDGRPPGNVGCCRLIKKRERVICTPTERLPAQVNKAVGQCISYEFSEVEKEKSYLHIHLCVKTYAYDLKTQVCRDTHFTVMVFVSGEKIGMSGVLDTEVLSTCISSTPRHFTQLPGMLSADCLRRMPLQALPSAACSCFAEFKPLPGDRLNPMTGFMQYRHRSPLPQFGTVLKDHPSFRALQGMATASVATTLALQSDFSPCLSSLVSLPYKCCF